jgi:5-hydroxyisourate hydrolase
MSTVSHVTTHVLDAARGQPAQGVAVRLERAGNSGYEQVAEGTTDADGRVKNLGPERLEPGTYRLTFDTGTYFDQQDQDAFYPEVVLAFRLQNPEQHYHVPVLLSPFAYSTYRGS